MSAGKTSEEYGKWVIQPWPALATDHDNEYASRATGLPVRVGCKVGDKTYWMPGVFAYEMLGTAEPRLAKEGDKPDPSNTVKVLIHNQEQWIEWHDE